MSIEIQTPQNLLKQVTDKTVDYTKLMTITNTTPITEDQISRIEKLSEKPLHHFLKRKLFCCQFQLNEFLDDIEANKPTFIFIQKSINTIYTLHDYITLAFAKYLQECFNIQVIIQILDDVKVLTREVKFEDVNKLTNELIKIIMSFNFSNEKTFVFTNYGYYGKMYRVVSTIQKATSYNVVQPFFNFDASQNIGLLASPAILISAMFSQSYKKIFGDSVARCLVLDCISQVQFFSIVNQIADNVQFLKPSYLLHELIPSLNGVAKMETPNNNNAILLNDNAKQIEKKILKVAFSGGRDSTEEHRRLGGQCEIDIAYQCLRIFCENDELVNKTFNDYSKGELLSGDLKKTIVCPFMKEFMAAFEQKKKPITTAKMKEYMDKMKQFF